ncbi:MAG: hypothetical protein WDO14_07795 [Bacteroidota bacterium]
MKCGGVSNALKIADIALQEGVELFWGFATMKASSALPLLFTLHSHAPIRSTSTSTEVLDLGKDV